MTAAEKRVAVWYIQEHFGELSSSLVDTLMTRGELSLHDLISTKKFARNEAKKCLCTLIQHGAVDCRTDTRGKIFYAATVSKMLQRARFPRYIASARSLFGDRGELVVADVLQHGRVRIGHVLERMREKRRDGADETSVRELDEESVEMFAKLVRMQYLCRAHARHVASELKEKGQS